MTILAGQTSATIDVSVLDDLLLDSDETVIVTLSGTNNSLITVDANNNTDTVTILDVDRSLVSIIANDDLGNEDSTPIDNGQFTVSLSQSSPTDTVVSYTVSGTANGGTDYTALSGTVTVLAGQTSAIIDVSVLDDLLLDSDETVIVTLSGTNNSLITVDENNNTDTVTIMDEDRLVSIVANDDLGNEDSTPIDNGQFTVSLTRATSTDTVVSYTVSGTANGGTDYTALSGTVTVLAGQNSASIDVSVLDDLLLDSDETVIVTLTSTNDTNIGGGCKQQYRHGDDFGCGSFFGEYYCQ